MFSRFNIAKFETTSRLCLGRIKLQRNKKLIQIEQLRKDIAELLRVGRQEAARIRVETVIRENLMLQAFEIMELYLELFTVRSQLIAKTKVIPGDMVEAVSSIIYAANRVSDIPELSTLKGIFADKYGKEYAASASSDVDCGNWQVNKNLISCLLVEPPQPEQKLEMLSDIAQKYNVEWDISESARVLLPTGGPPGHGGGAGGGGGAVNSFTNGVSTSGPSHQQQFQQGANYGEAQQAAQVALQAAAQAADHARSAAAYANQFQQQQQQQQYNQPPLSQQQHQHQYNSPPVAQPPAAQAPPPHVQAQAPQYLSSTLPHDQDVPMAPRQGRTSNGGSSGFVERSAEERQRAYDAAVGPPTKTHDGPSAPPPVVPAAAPAPAASVTLPSPPPATFPSQSPPPSAVVEDEFAILTRRLEELKRN